MKLEEWEEECNQCDGTGIWCNSDKCKCHEFLNCAYYTEGIDLGIPCMCHKCKGTGKVDFIKQIIGQR